MPNDNGNNTLINLTLKWIIRVIQCWRVYETVFSLACPFKLSTKNELAIRVDKLPVCNKEVQTKGFEILTLTISPDALSQDGHEIGKTTTEMGQYLHISGNWHIDHLAQPNLNPNNPIWTIELLGQVWVRHSCLANRPDSFQVKSCNLQYIGQWHTIYPITWLCRFGPFLFLFLFFFNMVPWLTIFRTVQVAELKIKASVVGAVQILLHGK